MADVYCTKCGRKMVKQLRVNRFDFLTGKKIIEEWMVCPKLPAIFSIHDEFHILNKDKLEK